MNAELEFVKAKLRELHGLFAQGLDESPEGEAIRDALDEPLAALTEADAREA